MDCRFCGLAIRETDDVENVGGSLVHVACLPAEDPELTSRGFRFNQWIRRRATAGVDRLRPKSSEGEVYRDDLAELFEVFFDAWGLLVATLGGVGLFLSGQWPAAVGLVVMIGAMLAVARVVFFRPHVVIGDDTLILVGVFRTRRIAFVDVRRAVATQGSLKLELRDGHEVLAPGYFPSTWSFRDRHRPTAQEINRQISG